MKRLLNVLDVDIQRHKEKDMKKLKIKMKLTKINGKMKWYRSGGLRRFTYWLTHVKFSKAYVWVGYGKQKDNHGKMVEFYNDGEYINKEEALEAIRAFCE